MAPRPIVFLPFDGIQSLDLVGPLEVFSAADDATDGDGYDVAVLTPSGEPVRASSGLRIGVDASTADAADAIDTLIVPGGNGTYAIADDERYLGAVADLAARSRRVVSVCSGAFVLARLGLLDGRRATTHWSAADLLAELHPAVDVDPDPIFVRDGHVSTSAGVTTGMDLALALVEEDLGAEVALAVAQRLVLFLRRPGSQSQFCGRPERPPADRDHVRELQDHIRTHPAHDLSVPALAARIGYSERQLTRLFAEEVGAPPARYVHGVRVDHARRLLEETADGVDVVASRSGFGSAETLRRAFVAVIGVSPSQYRERFTTHPVAGSRPRAPIAPSSGRSDWKTPVERLTSNVLRKADP